jgi:cyclophilin family peptidyl-prolyl cis-trans isomerase
MMRQISLLAASLLVAFSIATANVVVNTKSHTFEFLESDEVLILDLKEFFQIYGGEGPIVDFTLFMPVQDGLKELEYATTGANTPVYDGNKVELMTYKLADGGTYDHVYAAHASEFEWREEMVQFQLLANDAPVTVANFIKYINNGQYENVIVHRHDVDVLQAGALRVSDNEDYLLSWVERGSTIPFEGGTIENTIGTLAMARTSALDSASSEFFINLEDNSSGFGAAYTVFGRIIDESTALPLVQEMGEPWVYNLTSYFQQSAPVSTTPLYAPFPLDKESYVRFKSITIPPGNPDGVAYSHEFLSLDDDEDNVSEEEAANQAAFDISISGSELSISRHDTGRAFLQVNGSIGGDNEAFFIMFLVAYSEEGFSAFPDSAILQEGLLDSPWYGQFNAESYPEIMHSSHGRQHVGDFYTDLFGDRIYYIYDFGLESWLYIDSAQYPLIYAYQLGETGEPAWLNAVPETGNGTTIPRWFYNYTSSSWMSNDYEDQGG